MIIVMVLTIWLAIVAMKIVWDVIQDKKDYRDEDKKAETIAKAAWRPPVRRVPVVIYQRHRPVSHRRVKVA